MVMRLDRVVPFGRSLDEYIHIFSLDERDFSKRILSVAAGPASFNAEGTAQGYHIQSCDPLYAFSGMEIRDRFYAVLDNIISQIENTPDSWVWTYHKSAAALRENRISVAEKFYADYETGKAAGRYSTEALPTLSFENNSFELSLSSHFLFLYSDLFYSNTHISAIFEMLRGSQEARIFPLLTLNQTKSPHLEPVIAQLQEIGYRCSIEKVSYELQPGGNEMLRVVKTA